MYFTQYAAEQGTPTGVSLASVVGARVTQMQNECAYDHDAYTSNDNNKVHKNECV